MFDELWSCVHKHGFIIGVGIKMKAIGNLTCKKCGKTIFCIEKWQSESTGKIFYDAICVECEAELRLVFVEVE